MYRMNGLQLKILAMVCMVCSHMSSTIFWGVHWLDCIGRLTFPIFAFLLAEGFRHTKDCKKYLKRLFLFALVTELPFDLMSEGSPFYPFHQNVLFTFCIALVAMRWIEKGKDAPAPRYVLRVVAVTVISYLAGFVTFVDYFGYGILMVLLFYLFHEKPYGWAVELLAMVYINWELVGGLVFPTVILGQEINIPKQGFAVLALIPIWLYNGKRGADSKTIRYACYAFYPVHMLVLWLLLQAQINL